MIGVKFNRDLAARYAERLSNGQPVVAKSPIELLHLAGAATYLADQGAAAGEFGLSTAALPAPPPGHEDIPRFLEVTLAVQFCGNMVNAILAKSYDVDYAPTVDAVVYMRDGQPAFTTLAEHEGN